jgi:hypothetical protein
MPQGSLTWISDTNFVDFFPRLGQHLRRSNSVRWLFCCSTAAMTLSRIILITSTKLTKVRLETSINTEVDTRLHQRHRCYILSDAEAPSQASHYRRQMPGRQRLSPESMPGLADSDIAVRVHTSKVSSPPWMCFSDSGFRTGRRVVSYGLCPWAEGIMYQHFGGELIAMVSSNE